MPANQATVEEIPTVEKRLFLFFVFRRLPSKSVSIVLDFGKDDIKNS
jgi:hypothetical protein